MGEGQFEAGSDALPASSNDGDVLLVSVSRFGRQEIEVGNVQDLPSRGLSNDVRRLRVGLLVDDFLQPAWVAETLEHLVNDGIVNIAVVVRNGSATSSEPLSGINGLGRRVGAWRRNWRQIPFALYSRFDTRRYVPQKDPFKVTNCEGQLSSCVEIVIDPVMTKYCDYFSDADIKKIASLNLDVILRFGFRILKGNILKAATHGVWSFHHGDNRINRGGPPGFWEICHERAETGAVLQELTEQLDGGRVLAQSHSCTNMSSLRLNRANYYWQAATLLRRELRRLQLGEARQINRPEVWSSYCGPLYSKPGPVDLGRFVLRLSYRLIKNKLRNLTMKDQWFLAYSFRREIARDGADVPHGLMYQFKELVPSGDRFWADPFPVSDGVRHYVFFEEYLYAKDKGHISLFEVSERGQIGPIQTVLNLEYHLSYPYVFPWNGHWYMLAETLCVRKVQLFKAKSFPDKWEFAASLLDNVDGVDPTIVEIDGTWWLFLAVVVPGSCEATALHIYYADNPLGPWTEHPENPVKVDVRGSRPAGRIFQKAGVWYRPAQNGAPAYGRSVIMNRIDVLTRTSYHEVEVSEVTPSWRSGIQGVHSISAAGGLTVIDVLHRIRR